MNDLKVGNIVSINTDNNYWMGNFIKRYGKELFKIITYDNKHDSYKIRTLNKEKTTYSQRIGIKKAIPQLLPEYLFKM